jgi:hypothetical protein
MFYKLFYKNKVEFKEPTFFKKAHKFDLVL